MDKKELEKIYKNIYKLKNGNYCVSTKLPEEIADENYSQIELDGINGLEGKWGLVDNKGNIIIEPKYLYPFTECGENYQVILLDEVKNIDGKKVISNVNQGLINNKGEEIIPIKYPFMESIDSSNNYFRAFDDKIEKCGVLDKNNNIIVPFDYEYINSPSYFACTLSKCSIIYPKEVTQFAVKNNELYGIYDSAIKKEIIKPKYKRLEVIGYDEFLTEENKVINEKEEVCKIIAGNGRR